MTKSAQFAYEAQKVSGHIGGKSRHVICFSTNVGRCPQPKDFSQTTCFFVDVSEH